MAKNQKSGRAVKLVLFGKKAADTFSRLKDVEVLGTASKLGDIPLIEDVIGAAQIAISEFEQGKVGNVYIFANEYVNTMTQKPFEKKLLPIAEIPNEGDNKKSKIWDYIYEPTSK